MASTSFVGSPVTWHLDHDFTMMFGMDSVGSSWQLLRRPPECPWAGPLEAPPGQSREKDIDNTC